MIKRMKRLNKMGEKCEHCWATFRSQKYLLHHQQAAKYCQKYRYTMFTCRKCFYSTRGIKNIDLHNQNCKCMKIPVEDPIVELQRQNAELKKENTTYQTNIRILKKRLKQILENQEKLYTQIRLERFKNKIYYHLIEQNTSIVLSDILIEDKEGVHVYNIKGGDIPVFVYEHIRGEKGFVIQQNNTEKNTIKDISISKVSTPNKPSISKYSNVNKKSSDIRSNISDVDDTSKTRKKTYRTIKTCIELVQEPKVEDREFEIKLVDTVLQERLEEFISLEEAQELFNKSFAKLQTSRIYTKILNELRQARTKVFGRMSLNQYEKMVFEHIRTIEIIFREKNYPVKKCIGIISKGLSPLESRLVAYGNYTQLHLEIEEVQRLANVLELCIQPIKEYIPFDIKYVCNLFFNYGTVLFPIKNNIERYLINRYGFHNIIYLPLSKNNDDDPYSFYVLERVNKEKRYWKMDCRLEDLSINLISNVLPYMVNMFRKLYRDVFGDNEFRPNFNGMCQLTECDCEQLLQNIILMGQPKEFCNMARDLIKLKATYYPTENDKFNLYGDDTLQRKRFQDKEEIDLKEIVKQLFDGISLEDAVNFYRNRI